MATLIGKTPSKAQNRAPAGAADNSPRREPGVSEKNKIITALPQAEAERNARSDKKKQMHFSRALRVAPRQPSAERKGNSRSFFDVAGVPHYSTRLRPVCPRRFTFATLKYRIFGHPRFLLRGLSRARTEISFATMAYNLKRMMHVLGAQHLKHELAIA